MAFGITLTTDLKIDATFWVIPKVSLDRYSKTAYFMIYGFANKNHCDSGGKYLTRLSCNVDTLKFEEYFNLDILNSEGRNEFTEAYRYLKENDKIFSNAISLVYDTEGNLITN